MDILHKYKNWDYDIEIHSDWTKIRTWYWNTLFLESIDIKITNFCKLFTLKGLQFTLIFKL